MNTRRVIQNLQIIDVPANFNFCPCCGLHQEGRLTRRPGSIGGGLCSTCGQLPEDEQVRGIEAVRTQRASSRYYSLSRAVETYRNIVEGGITVGELITRLQALNPAAYVAFRYEDSDDGVQYSRPDPNPGDEDEILGTPFYLL